MRASIKYFHSPDIKDLYGYTPDTEDCFGFLLQIMVGPEGQDGEESFDIEVVTPAWLMKHHKREDILIGRHYLIVFQYDFPVLSKFISSYVSRCDGDTWAEVASKIGRLGRWEFEDYTECSPRMQPGDENTNG